MAQARGDGVKAVDQDALGHFLRAFFWGAGFTAAGAALSPVEI